MGISKRGNVYVRRLLITRARSVVIAGRRDRHRFGRWLDGPEGRAHHNVVVVALANKLARIAWAVLTKKEPYRATGGSLAGGHAVPRFIGSASKAEEDRRPMSANARAGKPPGERVGSEAIPRIPSIGAVGRE